MVFTPPKSINSISWPYTNPWTMSFGAAPVAAAPRDHSSIKYSSVRRNSNSRCSAQPRRSRRVDPGSCRPDRRIGRGVGFGCGAEVGSGSRTGSGSGSDSGSGSGSRSGAGASSGSGSCSSTSSGSCSLSSCESAWCTSSRFRISFSTCGNSWDGVGPRASACGAAV
ncbi:Uncharacterised protein [Corynebacterium cystitidis]|nr:Uncharacterised protein [Corynebacterium cystitidis]